MVSFKVYTIKPGLKVLCDLCNEDYTNSDLVGGILFSGKAVCPKCAPDFIRMVKRYKEQRFIKSQAKEGETFKDFVYRIRKGEY